ncbi:MAG TPA: carboxypeptidase-like regulatory domain-containing protein [Vicinamibacterales bacterium]|nr:carboxypeptidase-like regulatory domain-containing protein [Vicinamibacterales bacterium]
MYVSVNPSGEHNQQIPQQRPGRASIQGLVADDRGRGVPGAEVVLKTGDREVSRATTTGDGVFRFTDLAPGDYALAIARSGFSPLTQSGLHVTASALVTVELKLVPMARDEGKPIEPGPPTPYGTVVRPKPDFNAAQTPLPPGEKIYLPVPDRWNLPLPEWDRYGIGGDYPYVSGHWWDPFNQNRLKGDYPILGKRTFFVFTGVSDSLLEGRNLPTPSGVSTEEPRSERFFGRGGAYAPVTSVRTSFDLFRGDTSFRPIDWRVRVAPAYSLNFVNLSEFNNVNFDVRRNDTRLDHHLGLQEAFVEKKLFDIGHQYDFLSVRAGIQEFTSDFRGFMAVLEAPGVRVFGTAGSSRVEYNAAVFDLLEKDTNSGFNELHRRKSQVYVGNVYIQDFLAPGYTQSFSFHANRDDGALHYDRNGFLVRPAPIGVIGANDVHVYYLGVAGNGHIGRLNVSDAFYQALGHETNNPIAAQRIDVNAQMGALELSIDKDWVRIKGATFIASGDGDPSDGNGRGFDAIVDIPAFAGGPFSLWNRQSLRLAGTATGLKSPVSLLPTLRTNKDEGQPNFVNPGIFLLNGAADFDLTPKLRAFVTTSYLRFLETAPMEALLFQEKVRPNIGVEYGGGATYRPPLSDNIVIIGGVQAMRLGQGLKDVYERNNLFSIFVNARLQF